MNPSAPDKAKLPRLLTTGLLIGLLVFIGLVLVGDLRQVGSLVSSFQWSLYPLVIAFTLLNYSLRFVKWHFYLRQIGVGDLPALESARLFVAGFPLAVTPGKVGEALKAVWLNQATGVPISRGVSVVLAERISDGMAVILLSTLGVIAYPQYWPAFASVMFFLLGIVIVSQIRSLSLRLITLSERIPVIKRYSASIGEFYEGSYLLFQPRTTLVAVGLGTVSWLGEGIGLYLILIGLGFPPGWDHLSIAVFVLSFSTVIGAVSALPGGLGAAEVSIAGMLSLLLRLEADFSTTATLLIRFATLWFGVGLGLIIWVFSRDLIGLKTTRDSESGL